ncbi:hypothetical protein MTBPR1_210018 [Candidatus Terasakiella magnetica]|uniref:Uncharacterized protein n=1 Tax=Candidatus Terasakiella magnetica TaxID=1867952 RepID=A0A1C3RGZ4_9PROT|nr:hypothetical protein [Candidatus Terasakiella magnetica]SCA56566.1 hypothetical protein MTBPR1_210018 [Candidatus Terasakiella magnetica]
MTDYVYIRVPFYIPKYWALKGQYDDRLSRIFKHQTGDEKSK